MKVTNALRTTLTVIVLFSLSSCGLATSNEERLQRADIQGNCGPRLNPEEDPETWLARSGAPKPRLEVEKPQGVTVPYDDLIAAWRKASL